MKLPPFNHADMQWDGWRAFHVEHEWHKFVQFDTGEFVVYNRRWQPPERQVYKNLHLQIVATDDDECPKLYLPGMASVVGAKPIFKSHLNHKGMQTLLLDFDHKRAVSIDRSLTEDNAPLIPVRFTQRGGFGIAAWYAGPKTVPIGTPITRYYPAPLTHEQRTHIKELKQACEVWLQMQANPDALKQQHREVKTPIGEFIDVTFNVLTTAHRTAIAMNGFDTIIKEEHPWLTFNVEGEWTNDEEEETDD